MNQGVAIDLTRGGEYETGAGAAREHQSLRAQLADLATRYGKDVLVVETAYPWLLPSGDGRQYYVTRADQLPDSALFPATSQGQVPTSRRSGQRSGRFRDVAVSASWRGNLRGCPESTGTAAARGTPTATSPCSTGTAPGSRLWRRSGLSQSRADDNHVQRAVRARVPGGRIELKGRGRHPLRSGCAVLRGLRPPTRRRRRAGATARHRVRGCIRCRPSPTR
ncbi:hypothetical protein FCI23_24300 [Actinacidiphila oryziradicis]|uniref:Uncharacterized protein n=1 Tax=Actinacidiphila oryziradicis TaxID=2571141 RepID=A0A4U0SHP3_9ACTN|nr:hypothetical protein FCI23_24300 [Actinacidiphila oryziradicis]